MAKATRPNNPWQNDWIEKAAHFLKSCYNHFPLRLIEVVGVVAAAYYAYQAVLVASSSLTLSQQANESNSLTSEKTTKINEQMLRAADSSYKAAFEQLKYAKATADAQIQSLQEQKKQFELTTNPWLQVEIDENYTSTFDGWPATIRFKIKNMGKSPVRIEAGKARYIFTYKTSSKVNEFFFNYSHSINYIIADQSQYFVRRSFLPIDTPNLAHAIEELETDEKGLYLCGTYIYTNLLTKQKKRYDFVIQIKKDETLYWWSENYNDTRKHLDFDKLCEIKTFF
jgi:hypothetical protein